MKTPMQELLDITYNSIYNAKLLKDNGMNNPGEIDVMLNIYNVYRVIIERDMTEKEKEHIRSAYNKGRFNAIDGLEISSAEYFDQTYNQNK